MKRNYETPEISIQEFSVEDIVTTSTGGGADENYGGGGDILD